MFRRHTTERSEVPEDQGVVEGHETRSSVTAWSPAQIVAFLIGGAAIVFGLVALARTGLNTDHWYTPVATVLGVEHTPVLALAELGFGVLMLLSAMGPGGRPLMALLSAIALGFGIVVVADAWSSSVARWSALSDANGRLYVVVGAVGLLSATMMPTVHRNRHRVGRHHAGALTPLTDRPQDRGGRSAPAKRMHVRRVGRGAPGTHSVQRTVRSAR